MSTITDMRAWITRNRLQSEAVSVSLLALIVFVALGVQARRAGAPARAERAKLETVASEVASFRGAFAAAAPDQDMRIAQLADSLDVGVSREQRVALAHQIAAAAETLALSDVRVRFAAPDSATAPVRPDLSRASVGIADYSIAVDCTGGFAAVLSLVDRLPTSVALQRIVAANANGRTRYHIALAVFESTDAPSIGVAMGTQP